MLGRFVAYRCNIGRKIKIVKNRGMNGFLIRRSQVQILPGAPSNAMGLVLLKNFTFFDFFSRAVSFEQNKKFNS